MVSHGRFKMAGRAEALLLDTLLTRLQDLGLIKVRGRQRTDSTPVLAAVRVLNRLERVGETLRAAFNRVAVVAPEWLRAQIQSALAIAGVIHGEAGLLQRLADKRRELFIVFNHQHSHAVRPSATPGSILPPISLGNRRINSSESDTNHLIFKYIKSAEML